MAIISLNMEVNWYTVNRTSGTVSPFGSPSKFDTDGCVVPIGLDHQPNTNYWFITYGLANCSRFRKIEALTSSKTMVAEKEIYFLNISIMIRSNPIPNLMLTLEKATAIETNFHIRYYSTLTNPPTLQD